MSKTSPLATDDPADIDLKDPRLAAFLAWLVPGLGHFYQGRNGKGVLFFVCIVGTFFYGLYIGGGRVVYASTENVASKKFLTERWQYLCQAGVGLPALPAIIQRARMNAKKAPLFGSSLDNKFMRPPYKRSPTGEAFVSPDQSSPGRVVQHPDELAKWHYDLDEDFEIGTVFTVIAGLLNILAIFDAYGGPLVIPGEPKKSDDGAATQSNPQEK
jgi:hypothetical protein